MIFSSSFWRRFIRTGSPGAQRRFIKAFDLYFKSIHNQSAYRTAGFVPSPHDYATLRRDTSGCMMCYALTECEFRASHVIRPHRYNFFLCFVDANDLHIPDSVMLHPAIRGMEDASNDLVSFANVSVIKVILFSRIVMDIHMITQDIYSYNLEQSKGDTHNMIAVLMHRDQIPLQAAVERVGDICRDAIDRYNKWRRKLPSWGPEIDSDVARYADGLADWMVGVMHWSFETERYFGRQAKIVKKEQVVRLYPRAK
ncbi:hypothetical protein D9758_007706 [Tetrapyrgos nigripes]|uniref:Terpene synthase n=1 Tax=Tetrapyrgos nigripes TaxID=182062 RepID=A0A8H5G584_9AGAR|nr:hypothetical protein D9758_007706 [Tetrapyrgos nigripes]